MIGKEIHKFARELWPINRSLTGEGVRETFNRIKQHLPDLQVKSVPSGTQVFDWEVPKEWSVNEAYIITPSGEKICNFADNNLHLLGYSAPFKGTLSLDELKAHLYTLEDQPDAIPYITSYYKERWGFCLSHNQLKSLEKGTYQVVIDSSLFQGELNYAELLLKGKSDKEIFISTYVCHPSLANNELSGPTVTTFITKWLQELEQTEFSYRVIFIPETIGSITYLSKHHKEMKERTHAGFNVTCIGDNRTYSYLSSRNGNTISDAVAQHVLQWTDKNFKRYDWFERGGDERQYCSPGIDLPVVSIMRSKHGCYPEYHTSHDDLENVVTPEGLNGGYWAMRKALEALERNKKFVVTVLCEPQMGKRGLYPTLSTKKSGQQVRLMMNVISLCDGEHSLLSIAERLNLPIWELYELIDKLLEHNLIKPQ